MDGNRVTLEELSDILRERAAYRYARNLVLVALPVATAHRQARELAEEIDAVYVDFDCELLTQMEKDGWQKHVNLARRGTIYPGRRLAEHWLEEIAEGIAPGRPLVVGNTNLAVRYQIDVAAALYDASERGLRVLAAAGHLQGQTLLIHGVQAQTGAGSPAYEVVLPPEDVHPGTPHTIQDRLL